MNTIGYVIVILLVVYVAVCFGKIAAKHGKNPILYGLLSIISPVNLIILGYWAFSDADNPAARQNRG
jgi:membrane protein DedA with SNARE-associated domain